MTATQAEEPRRYSRRGVMRRTAIGIGAAAGVGAIGSTPVAAQDATDYAYTAGAYLLGGPAAGAIVAYGMIVDSPDDEDVQDALEYQNHVEEYTRAEEDQLILDQTLASLKRDVQLVENKAREEAIFKIYEAGVDGLSESDATSNAEEAINEAYATVEESILDSWHLRATRVDQYVGSDFAPDSTSTPLASYDPIRSEYNDFTGDSDRQWVTESKDVTLVDDTTITITVSESGLGQYWDPTVPFDEDNDTNPAHSQVVVREPDVDDYDGVDEPAGDFTGHAAMLKTQPWADAYEDLLSEHSALIDEVSAMVDSYFQPAADGKIDLTDIQGPAYLTDAAENAENFEEAALALRAMGFALADQASIVSVEVDGETSEFEGRLARSVDDPNPLPVGVEIEPSNEPGSIYGAFNQENDDGETTGEIVEITEPFTIEEAEDGSDEIAFENRELVEADSDLTNEEIQQLFAENYQAREDSRDAVYESATGGGGGGGFLEDSDQNWGLIAIGAGAVALGWGYITGDDS